MDGTALTIYHIRMQLTGFLRKNNAIFLRISGGVGFVLGLLYFPGTPLYILGTLTEREIGVWAGLIMILSILVFISAFFPIQNLKPVNILILTATIVLNMAALAVYKSFAPEALLGQTIGSGNFDIAFVHLEWTLAHLLAMVVAAVTILSEMAGLLNSGPKNSKQEKILHVILSMVLAVPFTMMSKFIGVQCRMVEPGGINEGWGGFPIPYYSCGVWGQEYSIALIIANFVAWVAIFLGIIYLAKKFKNKNRPTQIGQT